MGTHVCGTYTYSGIKFKWNFHRREVRIIKSLEMASHDE